MWKDWEKQEPARMGQHCWTREGIGRAARGTGLQVRCIWEFKARLQDPKPSLQNNALGWRAGSGVKNIWCSLQRTRVLFPAPTTGWFPTAWNVTYRDLTPSSGLCGQLHPHAHIHIHSLKIIKYFNSFITGFNTSTRSLRFRYIFVYFVCVADGRPWCQSGGHSTTSGSERASILRWEDSHHQTRIFSLALQQALCPLSIKPTLNPVALILHFRTWNWPCPVAHKPGFITFFLFERIEPLLTLIFISVLVGMYVHTHPYALTRGEHWVSCSNILPSSLKGLSGNLEPGWWAPTSASSPTPTPLHSARIPGTGPAMSRF